MTDLIYSKEVSLLEQTHTEFLKEDSYAFDMFKAIRPGRIGRFALEKENIPMGTVVDGYDRHKGRMVKKSLGFDYPVVKLTEDGNTWMSDNLFEIESVIGAVEAARGDVLVGGLGIGLFPTLVKDRVDSINIVELNPEVISLVFHQIENEKMKIIRDDIYHYLRTTEKKYDFIYIDVWQDTIMPMFDAGETKKIAARCLKPDGAIWCWLQELLTASTA
jgi:hypothetical protein